VDIDYRQFPVLVVDDEPDILRSFEINYPPISGKVKLNFVLSYSTHGPPGEPALPPELRTDEGARATFDLDLPQR
jgi:hypothetical protein